jgi:hypothetical protein
LRYSLNLSHDKWNKLDHTPTIYVRIVSEFISAIIQSVLCMSLILSIFNLVSEPSTGRSRSLLLALEGAVAALFCEGGRCHSKAVKQIRCLSQIYHRTIRFPIPDTLSPSIRVRAVWRVAASLNQISDRWVIGSSVGCRRLIPREELRRVSARTGARRFQFE